MTQQKKILDHLQHKGSITPIQALTLYGSFRLGSIIHRLRQEGFDIRTDLVENQNGNPYAKYYLWNHKASQIEMAI